MHPILAQRERVLIYLSAWLILGVLLASVAAVPGSTEWVALLLLALPLSTVYASVFRRGIYVGRFPFTAPRC